MAAIVRPGPRLRRVLGRATPADTATQEHLLRREPGLAQQDGTVLPEVHQQRAPVLVLSGVTAWLAQRRRKGQGRAMLVGIVVAVQQQLKEMGRAFQGVSAKRVPKPRRVQGSAALVFIAWLVQPARRAPGPVALVTMVCRVQNKPPIAQSAHRERSIRTQARQNVSPAPRVPGPVYQGRRAATYALTGRGEMG